MPPAFVLSQDQTLRKYLRSAFSKLFCSLKNCSVALFLKHWIYFAWLFNFQRTPAASRRQLIYNTTVRLLCQHFFQSFLETFEAVFSLAVCGCWPWPTIDYYTLTPFCCQLLFCVFLFLFPACVFFYKIRNKANHPLSVESGWCLLFFIVDVFYGDGFRRGVRRLLRLR